MYLGPIIINRASKFLGVFVKAIGYLFHFIFPKKRFTIPEQSAPLIESSQQSKITKIIWQTNYSNNVTLPIYINYLFNRLMSLDWEYRYVSTEARLEFIKAHAPERYVNAFEQLTDGAAQADFWRLFVLNYYGGVYMDIDAHALWPLSKMIQPDDVEVFLMTKHAYSNYFIAAAKGNSYLQKTLDIVLNNIEQRVTSSVYAMTGPDALNKAIGTDKVNSRPNPITCVQGSFTNEYFQYMDKPRGKWTHKKPEELLKS